MAYKKGLTIKLTDFSRATGVTRGQWNIFKALQKHYCQPRLNRTKIFQKVNIFSNEIRNMKMLTIK